MEEARPAAHRTILIVDVERFGDPARTNAHQLAVRDGMYKALRQALAKAGIGWASCAIEDRGDGILVLVPPESPKGWLVTRLPAYLAEMLVRHNAACPEHEQIRLRMALHAGEVHRDAHGFTGTSINRTFRLIEAPEAKTALRDSSGALVLIASDWFYDEVVRHYPTAEPSAFRQVHVLIKETDTSAWIRVIETEKALARPATPVPSYSADASIFADPSDRQTAGLDVFPIAIGYYQDPGFEALDVDNQAGRLVDLLARFGAHARDWPVPARQRGAGQVAQRLRHWSHFGEETTAPANTVLYWVGHGWSDGTDSVLAHADSPFIAADDGVRPASLARALQVRQEWANDHVDPAVEDAWALVIIDACRAGAFAKQIFNHIDDSETRHVMLIGVSADGPTALGRFTDALRLALNTTYLAERKVPLLGLAIQLRRLLGPNCSVYDIGDLTGARLTSRDPPLASYLSAPLDDVHHLEDVLATLTAEERQHFFLKAQGTERGELSWFFEGREQERAAASAWLREAPSGLLVVTGRAGAGKSALLGNLLVHSLPQLRDALILRGLLDPIASREGPPPGVFDAVFHLSGLTLTEVAARVAAVARLGSLPSQHQADASIAKDLDWLVESLSRRTSTLTLLVDALDEAVSPLEIARSLLARIAALPTVRVVVGTRVSTREGPDVEATDTKLLQALAAAQDQDAGGTGPTYITVTRDAQAVRRYVMRRLRAVRDHGAGGRHVENQPVIQTWKDADIVQVADLVAAGNREFLFARLAVYEVIESPRLLTSQRGRSLARLLQGSHQDLFDSAMRRLEELDDRLPVLLESLALARGRGFPEADGIWTAAAAALAEQLSQGPGTPETPGSGARAVKVPGAETTADWTRAIELLLQRAAAYIVVDTEFSRAASGRVIARTAPQPVRSPAVTVYRLAHRTFVEYFLSGKAATYQPGRSRRIAATLLDLADGIAAGDELMPRYLATHLCGHVADADLWEDLAGRPRVLDDLDPDSVTADTLRTLFGRREIPPPISGLIGARDALLDAGQADRPGLRQLATTIYSHRQVIDEPSHVWGVAAAQAGRISTHVRLAGHTAAVRQVCALSVDGRWLLASASDDASLRLWDPGTVSPVGAPLLGHRGRVASICSVPGEDDRSYLASGGVDGTIRLWDPSSGRQIGHPLLGHVGHVHRLMVLPIVSDRGQTSLLVSAGSDGTIRFWDLRDGHEDGEPLRGHADSVYGLCTLRRPGGREGSDLLASTGHDGTLRIWEPLDRRPIGEPLTIAEGGLWDLCELPAGHRPAPSGSPLLALAGDDGRIHVVDPFSGQRIGSPLRGHLSSVHAVRSIRVGAGEPGTVRTLLASCGRDGTIRIWNPYTGHETGSPLAGHDGTVSGLWTLPRWTGDSSNSEESLLASVGADGTVRIWDPIGVRQAPDPLAASRLSLAALCGVPAWDPALGMSGTTLLATSGGDATVRIWDPVLGRKVHDPALTLDGPVSGMCGWVEGADSRGGRLATAGDDGLIRIWDPLTGDQLRAPLAGHHGTVNKIFSFMGWDHDGHQNRRTLLVSLGRDMTVRIWDPVTGDLAAPVFTRHQGSVWGACTVPSWKHDGSPAGGVFLVTADSTGSLLVWDPHDGRLITSLAGHEGVVWRVCRIHAAPAGDRPATARVASAGSDGTVRLWDPITGGQVGESLTGHVGSVYGLCSLLSASHSAPDELRTLLASTGADGTVRIWDPSTGRQVGASLTGHVGTVWEVCAIEGHHLNGRDDRRSVLATVGDDGTVRIWDPVRGQIGDPLAGSPRMVQALSAAGGSQDTCLAVSTDGVTRSWAPSTASVAPVPGHRQALTVCVTAAQAGSSGLMVQADVAGRLHVTDRLTHEAARPPLVLADGAIAMCALRDAPAAVAIGDRSGSVSILDLSVPDPLSGPRFSTGTAPVRALCHILRPADDSLLACAANDGSLQLWNCATWTAAGPPLAGHDGWIWSLAAVPGTPALLASAGADRMIRLWDLTTFKQISGPLVGHRDQVRAVAPIIFGRGRHLLASGSHDGTIRLWDPGIGALLHTIPLGAPVYALLQHPASNQSVDRADDDATITVGMHTGIVTLNLSPALLPGPRSTGT